MTKLALHEALKSIVWTQFDFDEKFVVHRVEARHGSGAAPPFCSSAASSFRQSWGS